MDHIHHFHLTTNMAMGVPDEAGWVPKLVIRACRTCLLAEALHGKELGGNGEHSLHTWEAWTPLGLHDEGPWLGLEEEPP